MPISSGSWPRRRAGDTIGRIVEVLNFGGGDILEIAPPEGGETLLLPFTKEAVPIVDVAQGHVIVILPVEVEPPAASFETRPAGAPQDEDEPAQSPAVSR